jgi:hypothetical protein
MVAAGPHLLFMLRVMLFPQQIQLDARGGQALLYFAPAVALRDGADRRPSLLAG